MASTIAEIYSTNAKMPKSPRPAQPKTAKGGAGKR
jgi:hypothetical protein